jgi:anti-anti-sigma factor
VDAHDRPARRVFLSHTAELRDYPTDRPYLVAAASAVARAGDAVAEMGYFTAADDVAAELCRRKVRAAEVFVLIAGFRYGTPVRDEPEQSYCELEFEAAEAARLPRLVFLIDEDARGPSRMFRDLEHGSRQEAFRTRLRESGLVTATVLDPGHFELLLHQALIELPGTSRESRTGNAHGDPALDAAIAQLASNDLATRLIAISVLSGALRRGGADRAKGLGVLGAFVRGRASLTPVPGAPARVSASAVHADVQAALHAISARGAGGRLEEIDLSHCDLRGADLMGTRLGRADLQGSRLDGARLTGAVLIEGFLQHTVLDRADLRKARLEGANLAMASLVGADLTGARLHQSYLRGADFSDAVLAGVELQGALGADEAIWPGGAAPAQDPSGSAGTVEEGPWTELASLGDPGHFGVSGRLRGPEAEVAVAGEVDMMTSPQLRDYLHDLLDQGVVVLVLDCAEVTFLGTSGLSVLAEIAVAVTDRGGRFAVAAPSRAALRPLMISGFPWL